MAHPEHVSCTLVCFGVWAKGLSFAKSYFAVFVIWDDPGSFVYAKMKPPTKQINSKNFKSSSEQSNGQKIKKNGQHFLLGASEDDALYNNLSTQLNSLCSSYDHFIV